jgi:prepilin-type processing-associated H-X9-DG protein
MKRRAGFTRIDIVVALICVVFIFANVQVFSAAGQGHAKRQVCMANLKTLTSAWAMYANDHQGRIPCADIGYSWQFGPSYDCYGPGWYEWPHVWNTSTNPSDGSKEQPHDYTAWLNNPAEADWYHAIACGSLWTYIRDYNLYRCPVSSNSEYVTYAIAHSMNAYPGVFAPADWEIYYNYQINRPAERMVFICQGYTSNGAFGILGGSNLTGRDPATRGFWDPPPKRHDNGTTFSFVDGHVGYRKWVDQRTINYYWDSPVDQICSQDLMWLQKTIWGRLGYTPPEWCTPEF